MCHVLIYLTKYRFLPKIIHNVFRISNKYGLLFLEGLTDSDLSLKKVFSLYVLYDYFFFGIQVRVEI